MFSIFYGENGCGESPIALPTESIKGVTPGRYYQDLFLDRAICPSVYCFWVHSARHTEPRPPLPPKLFYLICH